MMNKADLPDLPQHPELTLAEKQYAVKVYLKSQEGQAAISQETLALARTDTRPGVGSSNHNAVRLPRDVGSNSMAARWGCTPEIPQETTTRIAASERMQKDRVFKLL